MLKVQELIHVINFEFSRKGRRKRFPPGFCYVCSQLDPRGRGGRSNPYRHLFAKGSLRPCPHLPPAPHPTFVTDDDEYDDDFDDGFDEDSLELGEGSDDGGMFDTAIVRDEAGHDPRLFSLPPVFGKQDEQQKQRKRRSKNGRLVPMVSENTFLTTNRRGQDLDPDLEATGQGGDLHLPRLSNQRVSLVAEESGQGQRRRKEKDPRRLHSERIDRRPGPQGEQARTTRSDSAIGLDMARSNTGFSREKTDPPPQPIVVSIKNQDGDVIQKIPLKDLLPGTVPSEAFAEQSEKRRRKREKKRRPRSGTGSASPSFSGSISISRETTLSGGFESPDYFMSRLRSASWCECPDHAANESRCAECRKVIGHERWCVSRNTICQKCGKAFKRKYSHLERKSSFGTIPASAMIISNVHNSGSPVRNRHQNCSPTKVATENSTATADIPRETSGNRVRFHEDGKVVFPQWETFPDSGVEEDKDNVGKVYGMTSEAEHLPSKERELKTHPSSLHADIHKRAYDMAIADAKLKQMFQKKKSKNAPHPQGIYFSYFPLLKNKNPQPLPDITIVSPTFPQQTVGLRADSRQGKKLKVKKGLKHVLGNVKLADYYPGGKRYPKSLSNRETRNEA